MKRAHLICRDFDTSDRIIPRLARMLSGLEGWTIGSEFDPKADFNYFFPYLEYDPRCPTKTGAWFTHREDPETWPQKAKIYDEVAKSVDIRTASAKQYVKALSQYGPTFLVPPAIDPIFQPSAFRPHKRPVVLVSGWVYPNGRKGEHLAKQLKDDPDWKHIQLLATGDGWPIHSVKAKKLKHLAEHFASADVFLCTSLVEGIPYPPLEALATGRPIVIPRGVGMLDELPSAPGIFRYDVGSYESLTYSLSLALEFLRIGNYSSKSLSGLVTRYSPANWRLSHRQIYNFLFNRVIRSSPPSSSFTPSSCGVYYVAFGDQARECASRAIPSFKQHHPDIPVILASDTPLGVGETTFIETPDKDVGGRIAKIKIDENMPARIEYILYLDADTEVVADISVMFQFLADGWDLIITKNPGRFHVLHQMIRPDNQDETETTIAELGGDQLLQLNGGVFAYRRNNQTRKFFQLWFEEWNRWGTRDQAALHRALWRQPLRVYVLGNQWNTVPTYDDPEITAGVIHYPNTARRWSGLLPGRLDSKETWEVVNRAVPINRTSANS